MVDLPLADYRDDPMLTTAANNALTQTVTVPGSVEASASDGGVWLTGMVGNRFQRDAAEQAVAGSIGDRGRVVCEIRWCADDCHAHIWRNGHRNHVLGDLFAQAHAGIVSVGDNIGQAVVVDDLNPDIRVMREEPGHGVGHRAWAALGDGARSGG